MPTARPSPGDLGKKGERAACRYLRRMGCRILKRNFRCPLGEIDVVAREGDTVVFLEVKSRSGDAFGRPQLAVTPRKRHRIERAALVFLKRYGLTDRPSRFDVVAVVMEEGKRLEIDWIRNAFESNGRYTL